MVKLFCIGFLIAFNCLSLFSQTVRAEAIPNESFLSYTLNHPLHEIYARSKEAYFNVEVDTSKKEIKSVTARVDVMTFDSGNSNRDSHAMEVIDALTYPKVVFRSNSVFQKENNFSIGGKVSFHGVTKDIFMNGSLQWSSGRIDARGNFDLSLTEFNIDRPSLLMIPVSDTLHITMVAVLQIK